MFRAARAAAIGSLLLLIFYLLHAILQELSVALDISSSAHRLSARRSQPNQPPNTAVTTVFNLALESPDVNTFAARLKQSKLDITVDERPWQSAIVGSVALPRAPPVELAAVSPKDAAQANQPAQGSPEDRTMTQYPPLTKELAHEHAHDGMIFVTWTNLPFVDFVQNWIALLQTSGIKNYVVGAMDSQTADQLTLAGVPLFAMFAHAPDGSEISIGTLDLGWGSDRFHQMGRLKIQLLRAFLTFELDIMLCDSDTAWLQDPTSYLAQFPAADMLVSSDHLTPTIAPGDEGLEQPRAAHSAMNIGLMFVRATEGSKAFVHAWVDMLKSNSKVWDQNVFNDLVRQGFSPAVTHESNNRLFYGWNGRLVVGVLPVATFSSGHTFHVQHAHELQELKPYVVHQTFQYGGTKGKRHRLREARLWRDPPEYYTTGGPYLHAELAQLPPPPDFHSSGNITLMSDFHLQNMEFQLLQMRDLFAMAMALNRTVILPRLVCYCDRYWGPLDECRVPGAMQTRLPFVCPLDHIFEPFHFDDDPKKFGPPVRFREHSFLDSQDTPNTIRKDVLTLEIEQAGHAELNGTAVQVKADRTPLEIREHLSDIQQEVLQLQYRVSANGGTQRFLKEPFVDDKLQEGFVARIGHMPAFWCCRMAADHTHRVKPAGSPYSSMMLGRGIALH